MLDLVKRSNEYGLAKFGFDYESIRAKFPNVVYCSVTGYGQNGPYAERPGYDMAAQGLGGILSINGEPDGPPDDDRFRTNADRVRNLAATNAEVQKIIGAKPADY